MKRYILPLIMLTLIALTGCPKAADPNDEGQTDNRVQTNAPEEENANEIEGVKNVTEETEPTERTETADPAKEWDNGEENVVTPATEPYEWEEVIPDGEYVCEPEEFAEVAEGDILCYKPVIYLYPQEETEVLVSLEFNGELTSTYPKYENGWSVTAKPDGTLTCGGRDYYCLFWEGKPRVGYDLSEGFCVAGKDTEKFLEDALEKLGLTEREANEFIIYWLPRMENNQYNVISFQKELYTENADLTVSPAPDTVIRVFMAWKSSTEPVEIKPQTLTAPERTGFAVVEWGGAELN